MWELYVHFSLLALNLAVWLVLYKKLDSPFRLLGWTLLLTALFEAYAAYLLLNKTRNLHLYHLLTPLQYVLYSLVFYKVLEGTIYRRAVILTIPAYLLVSGIITFFFQGLSEYNSYALSLKNVLLTLWVLLYYREIFTSLKVVELTKDAMFWTSTGLLFYSLGSFFVDGLMHYMLGKSFEMANAFFYISIFLGYLLHGTFLIAFLLEWKKTPYALERAKL
ncbi:hypothetical protein H7F15_12030 [Pontibacter sp. Tf4]|uniref:hypothetical protein n=1 Tax=Pontibacter sp. Tf4 TaxID=2761620 RepID=UPI00162705FF|nr:hypothetical protein [Pontibacter sp. Tf4]MBB6611770.1 hypothetical protein [Pontibacter sp. Tf4]